MPLAAVHESAFDPEQMDNGPTALFAAFNTLLNVLANVPEEKLDNVADDMRRILDEIVETVRSGEGLGTV